MGIDLARLADPFSVEDLEWRILQAGIKNGKPWGKCVAYVTNRAIMERLDEVCGPENWSNRFEAGPGGGIVCGISIRITREDGSADWLTKWDGAENTEVDGVKGGLSGAMKRAAVQWSCGRYLYDLPEGWASFEEGGPLTAKIEGAWYRWSPPSVPAWALPKAREAQGRPNPSPPSRSASDAKPAPLVGLDDEHTAWLETIRKVGAVSDDDAVIVIDGHTRNLKTFVRDSWVALKAEPGFAKEVAEAMEAP